MRKKNLPSKLAFLFVVVTISIFFVWWFRHRPSFLLVQLRREIGRGNSSAVVARYKHLLTKKQLPLHDELLLRKTLAEFYLDASGERTTLVLRGGTADYSVSSTFIDSARLEVKRILQLSPNDAVGHFLMGRILLLEGLDTMARSEFELSRKYDPHDPRPLGVLAQMLLERGEFHKAKEVALEALTLVDDFIPAREALIDVYLQLGQTDRALQELDKLDSRGPRFLAKRLDIYAKANQWDEIVSLVHDLSSRNNSDPELMMAEARVRLMMGQTDQAFGYWSQAAHLRPRSVWPLWGLASCAAAINDCKRLESLSDLFSQALPRWPNSYVVMAQRALCLNQAQSALIYLDQSLELAPNLESAIILKAQVCLDLRRFEELGRHLRPLLDQAVHQSLAYSFLAQSLYDQNKKSLSREMGEMAIQFNNRNPWGYAFRQLPGDTDTALGLNPYDPRLLAGLAIIEADQKKMERAEELVKLGMKRFADHPDLWLAKGKIELLKEQFDAAQQSLLRVISRKPYKVEAYFMLLECAHQQNQHDEARSFLTDLLQLNSSDPRSLFWKKVYHGKP